MGSELNLLQDDANLEFYWSESDARIEHRTVRD